jgi:hypothetical protein
MEGYEKSEGFLSTSKSGGLKNYFNFCPPKIFLVERVFNFSNPFREKIKSLFF